MSESKYREWILDTIDSLRSRKARPDLERICRMVRRRHGSERERTCAELEKLVQEQTVLKVNYKGSISYRNAAKVQRRSRKKDDVTLTATVRGNALEEASHSDLSNGDSALGPVDQDDEDLEADTSITMDTDSNADEELPEENRDRQNGRSSGLSYEDAALQCVSVQAASPPCSPSGPRPGSGSGVVLDSVSFQKAGERPSSLPPSSPRAIAHNNWAYHSAVCPAEHQYPGIQTDKAATEPAILSVNTSPSALKNNVKNEDGGKAEDSVPFSDQLVPDYATGLDETKNTSDGRPQSLSLPPDNGSHLLYEDAMPYLEGGKSQTVTGKFKNKMDTSSFTVAEGSILNGGKGDDVPVKTEEMSQNLLLWTVADVASYFSAAGFPEQAAAFRTQEIDGKSLLLMQRSDVLTGLSIRLGPALKIYERHIKVLQRTHFLECEDL